MSCPDASAGGCWGTDACFSYPCWVERVQQGGICNRIPAPTLQVRWSIEYPLGGFAAGPLNLEGVLRGEWNTYPTSEFSVRRF